MFELFVVDGNTDSTTFLRDGDKGAGKRGLECWKRPTTRYWSRMVSTSYYRMEFMQCGWELTRGVPGGKKASNGMMKQAPTSVFDVASTSRISRNTAPSSSILAGVQPGP